MSEFPCLRRKRKAWNCQSFCNWNLSTLKAKGKAKIASKSRTVEVTFYLWQLESHPAFTVISFPLHSPFKSTFEVKLCLQQLHEFLKQEEEAKRCKSIFMLCFLFYFQGVVYATEVLTSINFHPLKLYLLKQWRGQKVVFQPFNLSWDKNSFTKYSGQKLQKCLV